MQPLMHIILSYKLMVVLELPVPDKDTSTSESESWVYSGSLCMRMFVKLSALWSRFDYFMVLVLMILTLSFIGA